jgi:hypothetical protein
VLLSSPREQRATSPTRSSGHQTNDKKHGGNEKAVQCCDKKAASILKTLDYLIK